MAANVEIYTWSSCPFCIRAKALLKKKGVEFTEYCIDGDERARAKMSDRANGRTSVQPKCPIEPMVVQVYHKFL